MIKSETIAKWKQENICNENLYSLIIGFDISKKEKYNAQKYFDIQNAIPDKKLNAKILSEILEKNIGKEFTVHLENKKYAWNPDCLSSNIDWCEIKEYLSKCEYLQKSGNEYFGEIQVKNIYTFLSIFLDYPQKLQYQDIELYSINSNLVMNISSHGTFWLISNDKFLINKLFSILCKENFVIIKGDTVQ